MTTTTATPETASDLVQALGGHGSSARCPAHDDHQASLSISDNPKGGLPLIKCHAGCAQRDVIGQLRARGLWPEKTPAYARRPGNGNGSNGNGHGPGRHLTIVATYDYRDADGALVYQVVRLEPKTFRQRRPDGGGPDSWIWNMKGVTRTLYHLPQLLAAVKAGRDAATTAGTAATEPTLYIVEGEKDVHALESLDLVATTNTGGAGKWSAALSKILVKARPPRIVVIPDNDDGPGPRHAADVVRSLIASGYPANQVSTLTLPTTSPANTPIKDAADWVAAGGTRAELEAMAADSEATVVGEPAGEPGPTTQPLGEAEPLTDFIRDADGKIVKGAVRNSWRAIDLLGVKLWMDQFSGMPMIQRKENPPEPLADEHVTDIWFATELAFGFRPPETLWRKAVENYAHRKAVHPVRGYLDSLSWDGTPRIDRWLIDNAGAEDTPYTRAVSAIVLMAAVRRVRQPGCKFDEMLVLESPQGASKSSALAALCPREEWFTDTLPMASDSKQTIEQSSGCWIVEAAELSGMRKSEVEQVKAFLSRRSDRARLAFGHLPVHRPRQFIVIGTTNADAYLRDTTGNRRFWPVKTLEFDAQRIAEERDQLWAEAAIREAMGGPSCTRLAPELWGAAGEEQEARRLVDDWERQLDEALGATEGMLTVEDTWRIIGHHDPSKRSFADSLRMTEIMTRIGFERSRERRRVGGSRVYYFQRGSALNWIHVEKDSKSDHWADER